MRSIEVCLLGQSRPFEKDSGFVIVWAWVSLPERDSGESIRERERERERERDYITAHGEKQEKIALFRLKNVLFFGAGPHNI
jgi:hypothetical protein